MPDMRIAVEIDDLRQVITASEQDVERAITSGMKAVTSGLKGAAPGCGLGRIGGAAVADLARPDLS